MSTTPSSPSGRDFAATFEATYDARHGLRQGGTTDRTRDRLVHEERIKLQRQGYKSATVINLNPFPLTVYLGDMGVVSVPAAPPDGSDGGYSRLLLSHYRLSMRDMGDGSFAPMSVLPTELAQEVEREYRDTGGVFWYHGDGEPPAEELAAAKERQMAWYRREYQKAVDAWSRYHQYKFITDRQRDAARALYQTGELAELPEWMTITRAQSQHATCPACGEDVRREARLCRHCGFHIDSTWMKEHGAEQAERKRKVQG